MFELSVSKILFKFEQKPPRSSQKIEKICQTDLIQINQHFINQQILQLPAYLALASRVLCKVLFKSDTRSKLKKLERANRTINRALDISQILRSQMMTRILSECLLSPQSLRLAQRSTKECALNQSESSEESPAFALDQLEGW